MAPIRGKKRSNGTAIEVANVLGAGSSKLKKKIRDIERFIAKKRDSLPADVLLENERALETLKVELKNAENLQRVKKLSKKYHMIRFFEKKKALRKYKKAKKEYDELVSNDGEKKEIKKLRKKLTHAETDLLYVVNFPRDVKYVALFPNENDDNGEVDENKKRGAQQTSEIRNALKREIEQMNKTNTLPISLEDVIKGSVVDKTPLASNFETTRVQELATQEQEEEEDELFE